MKAKISKIAIVCLLIAVMVVSAFAFVACDETDGTDNTETGGSTESGGGTGGSGDGSGDDGSSESGETVTVPTSDDMFSDGDRKTEYETDGAITVTLNGTTATCSDSSVTVEESMITVTQKGVYVFSGTYNGTIKVAISEDDKATIVLRNAKITSSDYCALYVLSADKTFVVLEGENELSNTGSFATKDDNKVDGAIFCKDDVTIKGDGTLTVSSSAQGIVAKDDLKIMSGTITVKATKKALDVNDSVRIAGGTITLTSGKDGIHVENEEDTEKGYFYMEGGTLTITSDGDGIDASGSVSIVGGKITVVAGGGSGKTVDEENSTKGIKSTGDSVYDNCEISVNSSDDAIHSNASININGGTFNLASGDDGIHADESLVVNGGTITITKSYEGLEGKNVTINGGTIKLKASDDGINAAGGNDGSSIGGRPGQNSFSTDGSTFIKITGGTIYIDADGDGIDSNGGFYVSGGQTYVEGPTNGGNGALDYDGSASITGGTFVAIGATGMAMNFSSATQCSALVNLTTKVGEKLILTDESGNELLSYDVTKAVQTVVVSCPSMTQGNTYTLKCGSNQTSFTFSTYLYGSNGQGGGMNPGGQGGMNPGGFGRR